MARRPLSERLATERERMARLQDKVRKLEAQERRTERSRDTRRKVLLGALVMDELERDTPMSGELRRWLAERLPGYLQRENDRDVMARFMDGGAERSRSADDVADHRTVDGAGAGDGRGEPNDDRDGGNAGTPFVPPGTGP